MANYGGDLSKLVDALLGDLNKAIDGARGKGETLGEALVEGTVKGIASAKTDIADALIDEKAIRQRIKDLQKSSVNAARQMKRVIEKGMSPDYGANIARYDGTIRRNARDIEALTNQLREQGIVVRNNTKAYKDLQAALEDIGYVEKKQKSAAPRKNAASEVKKQTDAEKEHIKTVKETADAAADQAKAAHKTKQTHDDAANAAKERAKVEQQVVDVSAAQAKMANVAAAQTQKLTDATNKQAKALKAANTAMREQLNMEAVIRRYNKLMEDIGYDESTIEPVNNNTHWNLRNMVNRADMHLQTYYEGGHVNSFEEFTTGSDGRRDAKLVANWKSHTNKLKRFINKYAPYAEGITAAETPVSSSAESEMQEFLAAMKPLEAQIRASEKMTQQYAQALDEIAVGSITAATATERLKESLRGLNQSEGTQKDRIHAIYEFANQHRERDARLSDTNDLTQRIAEVRALIPQLRELYQEIQQMGVASEDALFPAAFGTASVLTTAITNKEKDLYLMEKTLEANNAKEAFAAQAKEKYGITTRSKKFDADILSKFKELIIDVQNGLPVEGAMIQLDQTIGLVQTETKAIEENTEAVEQNIQAKQKLTKADVGYHAGAIARLNKAETNGRFYGSRRDTGYYGTGYYFVDAAHKNDLTLGSYRNLPYTSVDISQYDNLFKADTDQKAGQLHQFLQDITRYTQDNELNDVNTLFDDFKNIFGETVLSQEEFAAKLRELTNFMQHSSRDDRSDSVSTQFMKSLGYGGIDTRGTRYADTTYGIVLYDLQEAAVLQANITDEIQKQGDMLEKINYAPGDVFDKNEDARIQGLFDAAAQREAVFAEFDRLYDGAAFDKLQNDLDEVNQQLKNTDQLLDLFNERINNPDKVLQEYKEDDDLSMLLGDDEEELAKIVEAGREQLVELEEQRVSLLQQQANIQAAMDAERPKIDAAWEQAKLNVAAAAADNAERQAQAEESIAKSAQETAKAKLTAIQRQAYNYRRSTDNSAALAEREGVLSGQLGEIESIRNEFPALEKACASAEKAVTKTLDGIREKMQETGLSNVAEEAKTNAMSTSQMLDAIADSIEEERKNVEAAADALSAARKGIGQAYSGVVYHGSKKPLDNITFDPNSGDGFRNLGTGMYYTPELLMASEYGKNIVQTTVDLKNCFMLIKDSITSIDDLYAAMGREVPKNPDWDTVTADLGAYLTSIANVMNFSKRMQQMGYDGIFSRGYGFGSDDEHSEQLVVYDEKYWSGLTTVPYEEMQVSAASAAESQNKLAQATADVAAAADRAAQQVSEHADATQQETAIKLTASEYQAALGGDAFDKLLRDFNVSERDASDLTRIAADAVRAQKMMIEGALSDNADLLRAGSQLFNESVQRASDELMRLGSTADGTDTALQDFYKYIGNKKIRYTDKDKAEFGGKEEWKAVRNSVRGMLTTSYRAPSADMLWEEILGLFPGMFDPNIVNESDQLKQIIDMTVRAKEAKKNNWKKILPIYGTTEEVQGAVASAFVDMGNALAQVNQEQAKLADGQQELAHATRQTTDELDRQNEKRREAVEAQEIIERTISEAIAQLRTAGDNETTLFSLTDVHTGEDLVDSARDFVENIAAQSNLKLGKFTVKDDLIQAQLYNDELKVAVNQTYRLQQATEETDAALELIGQSFSQNVKALNANNFDVEGVRARAAASVEKLKSSLHGLEYDTSGLEDAAKNIASQSDFTKFNNQLKAAQDQIQAIKNSTVSKNTMNQLANMQRDMQNANIELDTMKLKLQKLGDVEGTEDATKAIERMTEAVAAYNKAQGAEAQQKAYNDYSTARSEFRARLENLNVKKSISASASKADDSSSVDQYYEKLLSTLKEINKLDTDITNLQLKDGGSGVFSGLIQQLEHQRSVLMSSVESIAGEISSAFADGFVFGENQIKRPDLSVLDDFVNVNVPNTILDFFNDVNVQATIGAEKVAQFFGVLNSSSKIKLDFKSKILPQFQKLIEMAHQLDQLFKEGSIGGNNQTYADIAQRTTALAALMQQQTSSYGDDYSKWDKDAIGYIQAETKALLERGDALTKVAQAEQKYFSGMKKATAGETYDSTTPPQSIGLSGNAIKTQKQQLEDWINSFGKGKAVITDFTKTADGINKINFTIFDEATNSFHTFTAAMGSASDNIHYTETSMKNLTAGTSAATKVMQSLQETMDRLGALKSAGFNVDGYINQLSAKAVELRNQMQSVGDSTDVGEQTGLKNKAAEIQKMLRDLAKLEEQWRKTQQGIDEGTSRNLGTIDQKGNVYAQMYAKIRDAANGATISNQKFDSTTNTLTYTLTDADGKVTQMTASLDALTGTVNTQAGKASHLRAAWGDIGAGLGGIAKEAARYAVNLFQVMDIVRYMRTGFNEVLEIDTALTELKKVTNETDATYSKFLQTMSKTGEVVGSTVKDLTTSASDWARLNI